MAREVDLRSDDDYVSFVLRAEDLPFGAQNKTGSLVERALAVAQLTSEVLGAEMVDPIAFQAAPTPPPGRLGSSTVHLTQQLRGIPVFLGNQVVRFGRLQDVQRTQGRLAVAPVVTDVPAVDADVAADTAVRHLAAEPAAGPGVPAVDLGQFAGEILGQFADLPSRPTVLAAGPLEEAVLASLTWLPLAKTMRLCWDLTVVLSPAEGAYRMLVGADEPPAVLYAAQIIPAVAGTGSVYRTDPDSPRADVPFPRPWSDYGVGVDPALPPSPPDWVELDGTSGYAIRAGTGPNGPLLGGVASGGTVAFAPADAGGADQRVLNAFFGTCSMHDLLYLLGFREPDGSYQDSGTTVSGKPCTRVNVEVRNDPVMGTAHWWPLGRVPALRLGPDPSSGRSTALDMTIVVHEYMHGVTNRLVGGGTVPNPFQEPQSRGMAEGWGDYVAAVVTGRPAVGGWVTGDGKGMRRFLYDESFPVDQANFGALPGLAGQPYPIGEIWCATLMEMHRGIGGELALGLVLDALRDLPVNPGLLDGRDTILLALQDRRDAGVLDENAFATARTGIWAAFARFGMGVSAFSQGPSLTGVVADFTPPAG